jgi:hypothetical protein
VYGGAGRHFASDKSYEVKAREFIAVSTGTPIADVAV